MKAFKVWIPRLCEAYEVDNYEIRHGETAGKVRYEKLIDLRDSFPSLKFQDIRIVRAPEFDEVQPDIETFGKDSPVIGWCSLHREDMRVETMGKPVLTK